MPWRIEAFSSDCNAMQTKMAVKAASIVLLPLELSAGQQCELTLFDTVEWARRIFSFSSMHSAKQTEKN